MKRLFVLFLLLGCDEVISVRNQPPEVTLTGLCTAGDRVFFVAEVRDLEGNSVDVDLVAGSDVLGTGTAGDGRVGLSSSEEGITHFIEWGAACDGDGCVDPCADWVTGPSGLTACQVAPRAAPAQISVRVFASDGGTTTEASFDLTAEPCP